MAYRHAERSDAEALPTHDEAALPPEVTTALAELEQELAEDEKSSSVVTRPGERERYFPDHQARARERIFPLLARELLPWFHAQVPVLVVSLLLWWIVPGIGAFALAWLALTLFAAFYILRPVWAAWRRNAHRRNPRRSRAYGVYILQDAVVVRQPGRCGYFPRARVEEVYLQPEVSKTGSLHLRYRDAAGHSRIAEVWSHPMKDAEAEVAAALEAWVEAGATDDKPPLLEAKSGGA